MAIREDYYFPSTDGKSSVHAAKWLPEDTAPTAILQFIHGVGEDTEKYEETAEYFTAKGFIVVGLDLLGHGKTAVSEDDKGYFADHGSWKILCADIHKQYEIESVSVPNLPYFLLGHSLGSFIGRSYITIYDTPFTGCIFTGSTHKPSIFFDFGAAIARLAAIFLGARHRSDFINRITYGKYSPHFGDDLSIPSALGMTRDIFSGMAYMAKFSNIKRTSENLSIHFFSGLKDSVNNHGANLYKAADAFKKAGCKDVSVTLFPEGHHNVLRGKIKEEVWQAISNWMLGKIK